ncbi:hypothetical protein HK103_001858 [Boothiomyces macroporosus]|uniref:Threonylcarbamoyladenosine tRNA methylthiotransferase n=1 Tax=Boothiomyces macroporosus TaxID=261099 RepID=A0AAD5UAC6_9FUNG|nr:hypothetical protein HK103_001858 [Boothiomyces macroporosus]
MDDIEDIVAPTDGQQVRKSAGLVGIKKFKNSVTEKQTDEDSFLPGQASVYVKTWGCGHNNSDGEYMAGLLAAEGYNVLLETDKANDADVWVLNSCTVKGPSQQTFANDIQKGIDGGKKVVVAGCVPQGNPNGDEWKNLSIIGVQQIDQVVHVVEETLKGNTVKFLRDAKELNEEGKKRKAGGAPLNLPKIRRNPFIEIIPVNTGCLNQCTYCKTKHARGDLGSYSIEEIVSRVNAVLDEGVLEIWLTSEDIGAYGIDIGVTIVQLLWKIIEAMENHPSKIAKLRVGMTNPPYILEHLEEMAKILSHERVYSFLHVPVQAGSTKVLDDMRRLYKIEDFERVCDILLEKVPGITLATDIICGFPTEAEEDFDETMRILEKYRFSVLHISQFYPRPGTPAARMKRVPTQEVKKRSRRATAFFESYTSYDKYLNEEVEILITEASSDGNNYIGHDKFYHQVLVEKDPKLMGQQVRVRITKTSKWNLMGTVIPESLQEINSGTVLPKRIPKLVRVNKQVVVLEENTESDQRADGALLSMGKVEKEIAVEAPPKGQLIKYGGLGVFSALVLAAPIRATLKASLIAFGAIATHYYK